MPFLRQSACPSSDDRDAEGAAGPVAAGGGIRRRPARGRTSKSRRLSAAVAALAVVAGGLTSIVGVASTAESAAPHPTVSSYMTYWAVDAGTADMSANYEIGRASGRDRV